MAIGISEELLKLLACPKCKGDLAYNKTAAKLKCKGCKKSYNIKNGVPIMITK